MFKPKPCYEIDSPPSAPPHTAQHAPCENDLMLQAAAALSLFAVQPCCVAIRPFRSMPTIPMSGSSRRVPTLFTRVSEWTREYWCLPRSSRAPFGVFNSQKPHCLFVFSTNLSPLLNPPALSPLPSQVSVPYPPLYTNHSARTWPVPTESLSPSVLLSPGSFS